MAVRRVRVLPVSVSCPCLPAWLWPLPDAERRCQSVAPFRHPCASGRIVRVGGAVRETFHPGGGFHAANIPGTGLGCLGRSARVCLCARTAAAWHPRRGSRGMVGHATLTRDCRSLHGGRSVCACDVVSGVNVDCDPQARAPFDTLCWCFCPGRRRARTMRRARPRNRSFSCYLLPSIGGQRSYPLWLWKPEKLGRLRIQRPRRAAVWRPQVGRRFRSS